MLSRQVTRTKKLITNKRTLSHCVIKCSELTCGVACKENETSTRRVMKTAGVNWYFKDATDGLRRANIRLDLVKIS